MPINPYTQNAQRSRSTSRMMSCGQSAAMGFGLGGTIGVTVGVLFGGVSALANPKLAGRRIGYVAKLSTQTGAMFGVFVAAGFLMRGC
ncbi:hypothetical protein AAMO2058_001359000 [Amorphochlora amoebiformis]|eukprot:1325959-Amorphochlora_amoeboformis.AAC.1